MNGMPHWGLHRQRLIVMRDGVMDAVHLEVRVVAGPLLSEDWPLHEGEGLDGHLWELRMSLHDADGNLHPWTDDLPLPVVQTCLMQDWTGVCEVLESVESMILTYSAPVDVEDLHLRGADTWTDRGFLLAMRSLDKGPEA